MLNWVFLEISARCLDICGATQLETKPFEGCSVSDLNYQLTLLSLLYQISPDDNFTITKDGGSHRLVIIKCLEEHSGKYRFEADGRKTEAMINVRGLKVHDNI